VVVVTGIEAREAEALGGHLGGRLGAALHVVADPSGDMADRFQLTAWPSVIDVDAKGRVVAVRSGVGEVLGVKHDHPSASAM
jgi:hypothetical protein